MVTVRSDYDDWRTEGWYSKDLLPIFREVIASQTMNSLAIYKLTLSSHQLENYHNTYDPNPDKSVHGFSGRFHTSAAPASPQSLMTDECLNAAKSLGYPIENDMQNFKSGHGFSVS